MRTLFSTILCLIAFASAVTTAEGQTTHAASDNPLNGLNLDGTAGATTSNSDTASTNNFPWSPFIPNNLGTQSGGGFGEEDAKAVAHDLGAHWLGIECGWASIESVKGTYNFASIDKLTDMLLGQGLEPVIIFDYGSVLYQNAGDKPDPFLGPTTADAQQAYANYCGAVAAHLAQRFPNHPFVYEIWNEPDNSWFWHPAPDAEAYTRLCKLAYPAIKQAAPNSVVMGPATASATDSFIADCINQGLLDAVDAVSVHPYRRSPPESVIKDYEALHQLISRNEKHDRTIPLVCSEWGYNATTDTSTELACDPQLQAPYLARMWLIAAWQNIGFSIWFQWRGGMDAKADSPWNFGMVQQDRTPRASYTAAKTLIDTLRGYRCTGRIDLPGDNDYALSFENPATGATAIAAWTTGDPHTASVAWSGPGNATLVTMLGEHSTLTPNDGHIDLPFSSSPVYAVPAK